MAVIRHKEAIHSGQFMVAEFEAEEDSSSENEDEIDADEMSKLKSRQRRSSRVARPVYDTFVDKKVSAS